MCQGKMLATSTTCHLSILLLAVLCVIFIANAEAGTKFNATKKSTTDVTNSSVLNKKYFTTDYGEQAYVSGSGLVPFSNSLLAQEKSDVLDSILYAELTANQYYDRLSRYVDWYNLYISVLQSIGWDITPVGFTRYNHTSGSSFRIADAIQSLLSPLCQETQRDASYKRLSVI